MRWSVKFVLQTETQKWRASVVVTFYIKLFRAGVDRRNGILISLILLVTETMNWSSLPTSFFSRDSANDSNSEIISLLVLGVRVLSELLVGISTSVTSTLRKKYLHSEFFWSVFSRIWKEYSVRMGKNVDQIKTPNTDTFDTVPIIHRQLFLCFLWSFKSIRFIIRGVWR